MKTHYDFIIIDTAPNENMVLYNCLAASDLVIIPLLADRYSLQGLSELDILISDIKHSYNKSLKIAGLLLTRFKPGQLLAQEVRKALEGAAKKIKRIIIYLCIVCTHTLFCVSQCSLKKYLYIIR